MLESDLESFESMLDSVSGLISRGRYTPNAEATALFFNAMRGYDLAIVSAAFTAHVRDPVRGKFAPTPADLIAQIDAGIPDGRPGADEAWAMMPTGEEQTVVWTSEMSEAFGICAPLLWMLHARGYDLNSLRKRESETETEKLLRQAREENAALRRVLMGQGASA